MNGRHNAEDWMMGVRKFTPDDCDLIKREYLAHVPVSEIANKLGRSEGTVRQKIRSLRLRRPRLGTKSAPEHLKAHSIRLKALMECLNPEYGNWGGQTKFAKDIGVTLNRLN